jgi:GTPase SAR1 family protein
MHIWDTAGQETFRSVTKVFYRNTHAILLCYAINNRQSFEHIKSWLNEVEA